VEGENWESVSRIEGKETLKIVWKGSPKYTVSFENLPEC
jgi:hypothetical protein